MALPAFNELPELFSSPPEEKQKTKKSRVNYYGWDEGSHEPEYQLPGLDNASRAGLRKALRNGVTISDIRAFVEELEEFDSDDLDSMADMYLPESSKKAIPSWLIEKWREEYLEEQRRKEAERIKKRGK